MNRVSKKRKARINIVPTQISLAVALSFWACNPNVSKVKDPNHSGTNMRVETSEAVSGVLEKQIALRCPSDALARELVAGHDLVGTGLPVNELACVHWTVKGHSVLLTARHQQSSGPAGGGCFSSMFEIVVDGTVQRVAKDDLSFDSNPCNDSDSSSASSWHLDEQGRC